VGVVEEALVKEVELGWCPASVRLGGLSVAGEESVEEVLGQSQSQAAVEQGEVGQSSGLEGVGGGVAASLLGAYVLEVGDVGLGLAWCVLGEEDVAGVEVVVVDAGTVEAGDESGGGVEGGGEVGFGRRLGVVEDVEQRAGGAE